MKKLILPTLALISSNAMAGFLTGAIDYVSTADGSASTVEYWNTIDTDTTSFNLYLSDAATPASNADILNPNGTPLSYALGVGIHDLVFVATYGAFIDQRNYFTLNLFFDGGTEPGISAVWNSASDTFTGAATSGNTRRVDGSSGAASGGLSYTDTDGYTITLTSLSMFNQPGVNIVGGFSEVPDGLNDQFTRFTLEVEPAVVPVPGAVWLFLSAIAGIVGLARRTA